MSAITTHVLDTVLGKPAAGIFVRLEKIQGGWTGEGASRAEDMKWTKVAEGETDADGRCRDLRNDAGPGTYRLRFDVGAYFRRANRTSIYPEIVITFECAGEGHYHLPVLLSDNSYTTYRGS
jgi:5-hydroxyisourate hydrolase